MCCLAWVLTEINQSGAPLRLWNFLLLAVLTMDWSDCALLLWKHLSQFSRAYIKTLQDLLSSAQNMMSDAASIEINQTCISVRLWFLLVQQICGRSIDTIVNHTMDQDHCEQELWNELWPSFGRLITFSLDVAASGDTQVHIY